MTPRSRQDAALAPGAHGGRENTRKQAIAKAEAVALRVMADRLEHEEEIPKLKEVFAVSA